MTSHDTFPQRFTKIDDLTLADHTYLTRDDSCYFLGEYTARHSYSFSATNNLIRNFKKGMDRSGLPEWYYKLNAIEKAATAFSNALKVPDPDRMIFVPIPPSKAKCHTEYDDRVSQMLTKFHPRPEQGVQEIILQTVSTKANHNEDVRLNPHEIFQLYKIDESKTNPEPSIIAIVDDVLTTGAHYRAAHKLLEQRFTSSAIVGLFIARRAPKTSEIEDT